MKLYFNRWNLTTRIEKMSQAATVIQNYLANKISNVKKNQASENLKILFTNHFKFQVAELMKKASRINKNSANVLYSTLKTIYIERPFYKLKKHADLMTKVNKLHHVLPILQEKFKLYWLPFYLRKWKAKTWDLKMLKLNKIQNYIRGRLKLWKEKVRVKKENLLRQLVLSFIKNILR